MSRQHHLRFGHLEQSQVAEGGPQLHEQLTMGLLRVLRRLALDRAHDSTDDSPS